ncbi:MAG: tetratricopeptide repeat protein [Candidatus Thorarchaeota archaeon]|nr:tetratricopeptide repeat protein [Candidatus Thorarchaeota archaeon]
MRQNNTIDEVENSMAATPDEMTQYDWFGQARIHEVGGNFDGALKAYENAIRIDPNFAKAWYYKAKLHLQMGDKANAKKCAETALELEPNWKKHIDKILSHL